MATTGPSAQAIILSILAGLGVIGDSNNCPVNYAPATLIASYVQSVTVPVPAAAANQQITLATLFPGITEPQLVAVQEVSVLAGTAWTGVLKWSWANTGTKAQFLPGDLWLSKLDPAAALPNLFIDNTDANNGAILNITCIGS